MEAVVVCTSLHKFTKATMSRWCSKQCQFNKHSLPGIL